MALGKRTAHAGKSETVTDSTGVAMRAVRERGKKHMSFMKNEGYELRLRAGALIFVLDDNMGNRAICIKGGDKLLPEKIAS